MADPLTAARWALAFRIERGDASFTRADLLQAGVTRQMITLQELKNFAKECARINELPSEDADSIQRNCCYRETMSKKIQMYLGLPYHKGAAGAAS